MSLKLVWMYKGKHVKGSVPSIQFISERKRNVWEKIKWKIFIKQQVCLVWSRSIRKTRVAQGNFCISAWVPPCEHIGHARHQATKSTNQHTTCGYVTWVCVQFPILFRPLVSCWLYSAEIKKIKHACLSCVSLWKPNGVWLPCPGPVLGPRHFKSEEGPGDKVESMTGLQVCYKCMQDR